MNTKEVIKYFENYLKASSLIGGGASEQDKMFRKAIPLLKRGEKFEKMYNEIKFIAGFNISVDEERDEVITMLQEYVKNMKVKRIIIRTNKRR